MPVAILSAWAGHHDARFTMTNYVHVNDEDLAAGAAPSASSTHDRLKIGISVRNGETNGPQMTRGPDLTEVRTGL